MLRCVWASFFGRCGRRKINVKDMSQLGAVWLGLEDTGLKMFNDDQNLITASGYHLVAAIPGSAEVRGVEYDR